MILSNKTENKINHSVSIGVGGNERQREIQRKGEGEPFIECHP